MPAIFSDENCIFGSSPTFLHPSLSFLLAKLLIISLIGALFSFFKRYCYDIFGPVGTELIFGFLTFFWAFNLLKEGFFFTLFT